MDIQVTIKSILAAVVGVFLLCTVAKADDCISVESFVTEFAKENIHFRGSTTAATERLAKVFNDNREASGHPKIEISLFLFGPVRNTAGDIVVVAAVVDKHGCVVEKTINILTLKQFTDFMLKAESVPKDLIPLDGAL